MDNSPTHNFNGEPSLQCIRATTSTRLLWHQIMTKLLRIAQECIRATTSTSQAVMAPKSYGIPEKDRKRIKWEKNKQKSKQIYVHNQPQFILSYAISSFGSRRFRVLIIQYLKIFKQKSLRIKKCCTLILFFEMFDTKKRKKCDIYTIYENRKKIKREIRKR